jgi:hypothetical protein
MKRLLVPLICALLLVIALHPTLAAERSSSPPIKKLEMQAEELDKIQPGQPLPESLTFDWASVLLYAAAIEGTKEYTRQDVKEAIASPSGCEVVGTGPWCAASPQDCSVKSKNYCGDADGFCVFGKKVLCCNTCP